MPGTLKLSFPTQLPRSDLRDLMIQFNQAVLDDQVAAFGGSIDIVWSWQSVAANSGQALGRGSTDVQLATSAVTFAIGGAPTTKAAVAAGTAFGALGVIPANTWGVIAVDVVGAGTLSFLSGAANYTTGYTTEALAIAALPGRVQGKARLGYVTIQANGTSFTVGTDALFGGATGQVAVATNYYPYDGCFAPTGIAADTAGVVHSWTTGSFPGGTGGPGLAWTGGRNGVLIPTVLSRGGTDTQLQTTAFSYNARGAANLAKAAVAAGTAFGSLGTIPTNTWGIIVMLINSLGTFSFLSGPSNYMTGYSGELMAIQDLASIYPATDLCQVGFITIKTKAGSPFIVGTDALAGGASGNVASATNYYPTPGQSLQTGMNASQIANTLGQVLTAVTY